MVFVSLTATGSDSHIPHVLTSKLCLCAADVLFFGCREKRDVVQLGEGRERGELKPGQFGLLLTFSSVGTHGSWSVCCRNNSVGLSYKAAAPLPTFNPALY
jgi:hypothetical protein